MSGRSRTRLDDHEKLTRKICRYGKVIFSHSWNSGAPGSGAGVEVIKEWRGQFAYESSDEYLAGPYDSFELSLKENDNILVVGPATERIYCRYMDPSDIVRLLRRESSFDEHLPPEVNSLVERMANNYPAIDRDANQLRFNINEEDWVYENDIGFRPERK